MEKLSLLYRPKNLSELVGQSHIVEILEAILDKHFKGAALPSGLLFCGSRGLGKTSTARIIARVLNCTNRKGVESCGVCSSCISIAKSNDVSVLEIDAASNGLVDDIRKLKDIALTSHNGSYRVIIIDEVHGCSTQGFQALLKILEEPPKNTLFIMATTEAHKVPDTIKSRLLVFEFKRLSITDIVSRLNFIAEAEKLALDEGVGKAIAKYVNGGMRDAVMILDQLHYSSDHITTKSFKDFFGIVENDFYISLIECLLDDFAKGLILIDDIFNRANSITIIINSFMEIVKNILLVQNKVPDLKEYEALAGRITSKQLFSMLNILWEYKGKIKASGGGDKVSLEVLYIRLRYIFHSDGIVKPEPTAVKSGSLAEFFKK